MPDESRIARRSEEENKIVRKSSEPLRVKDEHTEHIHEHEGLSDNMKGFYSELTTLFPGIRMTSGKRVSSPSGGDSHHHTGDAIDIGKEHTDVFEFLTNTKEGLGLMYKYDLGILDETDPRTMEQTGATGPHFHIGKDSGLYKVTKTRYEQFEGIQPTQSFYRQNPNFDYSEVTNFDNANFNLNGTYNPEASVVLEGPGPDGGTSPFRLVLPNNQVAEVFTGELQKEEEKENIKSEKREESEYRKLFEQKQKEEQKKIQQVVTTMNKIRSRDEESLDRESLNSDYSIPPVGQAPLTVQKGLPNLPSIFKI